MPPQVCPMCALAIRQTGANLNFDQVGNREDGSMAQRERTKVTAHPDNRGLVRLPEPIEVGLDFDRPPMLVVAASKTVARLLSKRSTVQPKHIGLPLRVGVTPSITTKYRVMKIRPTHKEVGEAVDAVIAEAVRTTFENRPLRRKYPGTGQTAKRSRQKPRPSVSERDQIRSRQRLMLLEQAEQILGSAQDVAFWVGVNESDIAQWQAGKTPRNAVAAMMKVLEHGIDRATTEFGSPEVACQWLAGEEPLLQGNRPVDILKTEGITRIDSALVGIRAGAYA